jgi:uncharacterized protein YndB with AHSA1/START domain
MAAPFSSKAPTIRTEMLIRKPVAVVFEAFVDPKITTRFWFTKSSGRLEVGKEIRWTWEMYGASTDVSVRAIEPNRRILVDWDTHGGRTVIDFGFEPRGDDQTLVSITNTGFGGQGDELVAQLLDGMGGFTLVLAGAKAVLEHDIALNLIGDRYPDGH